MNIIKKFFAAILCVIICTLFVLPVSAQDDATVVTVSTKTAVPGDEIVINIDIDNSPGYMSMAFKITYNSDILTYTGFTEGILNDYEVVDHPSEGYISFVNSEKKNIVANGTILSLGFTVKDGAKAGMHTITLRGNNANSIKGCFSKEGTKAPVPKLVSGGVEVGEDCSNSPHKFGEWTVDVEPKCEEKGLKSHSCTACGHTENEEIDMLGHDFDAEWTVDREATKTTLGIMSRHCKNCDAVTDTLNFDFEEVEDTQINNTEDSKNDKETLKDLENFEDRIDPEIVVPVPEVDTDNQTASDDTSSDIEADADAPSTDDASSEITTDDKPQENNPLIWLAIPLSALVIAVLVLMGVLIIKRKKQVND